MGILGLAVASAALTFVLLDAAPGDFLSETRLHPQISEETLAQLRTRYQLDRSAGSKFAAWLMAIPSGDWGRSLTRDVPVFPLLASRGFKTFALALSAQAVAWILALGLGFAVVTRPNSWLDRSVSAISALLLSVPDAVIALLSILLFANIIPGGVPPAVTAMTALVLALVPSLWIQTRDALMRAAKRPFVQAASINGLPTRLIWKSYLLPAASPALLPLAGLSIGSLLSSSLLIECIASFPGLGPLLLDAVLSRDSHVVVGCIFSSTLFWALGRFAMDLAQWKIDPRLQEAK